MHWKVLKGLSADALPFFFSFIRHVSLISSLDFQSQVMVSLLLQVARFVEICDIEFTVAMIIIFLPLCKECRLFVPLTFVLIFWLADTFLHIVLPLSFAILEIALRNIIPR